MAERLPKIPSDEYDWVELYLEVWARAMHSELLTEGYPDHSAVVGGSGWGGYKEVLEDWGEEANERSTAIVDMLTGAESCVLSPAEKCAVLHVWRCAVFQFREPVEDIYRRARAKIGVKLRAADFG